MPDFPVNASRNKSDKTVISQQSKAKRHANYYFEDGVVFQVENTLFKVPRRKLCLCSPVFDSLFTLPASCDPSAPSEGMSDDLPIILPQVSALDFERLLTYMYPLGNNYLPTSKSFSRNWTPMYLFSIMKLSKQFMMDDIFQEGIQALNSDAKFSDEVTKIQFGIEFNHPPWVKEGYSKLVIRESPLNIDEAGELGFEDAFRCMAAREVYLRRRYHYGSSASADHALKEHFGDDERIFGNEADDVNGAGFPS